MTSQTINFAEITTIPSQIKYLFTIQLYNRSSYVFQPVGTESSQ